MIVPDIRLNNIKEADISLRRSLVMLAFFVNIFMGLNVIADVRENVIEKVHLFCITHHFASVVSMREFEEY